MKGKLITGKSVTLSHECDSLFQIQTQAYGPFTDNSEIYVIVSDGFFSKISIKNSEREIKRESETQRERNRQRRLQ